MAETLNNHYRMQMLYSVLYPVAFFSSPFYFSNFIHLLFPRFCRSDTEQGFIQALHYALVVCKHCCFLKRLVISADSVVWLPVQSHSQRAQRKDFTPYNNMTPLWAESGEKREKVSALELQVQECRELRSSLNEKKSRRRSEKDRQKALEVGNRSRDRMARHN